MQLQESGEMYLETILILSRQSPSVRAVDVAESMGFSKPSVSRAIGLLKTGGYVTTDRKGGLCLTESGTAVATAIYRRHKVLTDYLVSLGVEPGVAAKDACKMEHVISAETFEALCRHAEVMAAGKESVCFLEISEENNA